MQPSDFSSHGAVDLGARKAAMEREAKRQSAGSSGAASQFSFDVTEQNFQTDVLERSTQVPVVLALLASWSDQSQQVETALDRLVAASGGQWHLAKIDTEASPQLAQALRAQTVPMVAMVVGGQVVPGPAGPATEPQLRDWLTQIFDALRQQGVIPEDAPGVGPETDDLDEPEQGSAEAEAAAALQRGDIPAAEAAFTRALEADPNDAEAKAGLGYVRLVARVQAIDVQDAQRRVAENADDVTAQCEVADAEMAAGQVEEAFTRLVGLVRRTREDARDQARQHLLGLFDVLPANDPRLIKGRRDLTSALF
ncbi:tetratricopeptide repeat protein [Spiractinospora alimapuensis]|uniref:tetratricopeptide repeat protein n=1 Tax=Spiractinospora alimapuensis TaxID=2820884 RepID=UPI001F359C41|nr:tetratricopeptide repeat protein [Spiractinospora alimapuensis]QVQ54206.1 tetratricopeptide repeat protein [Spiractinospora alimapuensis]